MIVDESIAELIKNLEYKIGNHTYNPNSYNGWTGEEGCEYKFPVSFCKNKDDLAARRLTKSKDRIVHLDPECVDTMKYVFGTNHLYIGDGLVDVLNYLEELYDIDFNKLEKLRLEQRMKRLKRMNEKINSGEGIEISTGIMKVGLDIPAGKYRVGKIESCYVMMNLYDSKGDHIDNIFTRDDKLEILLEQGNYVKFFDKYLLKKA